MTVTDEWLTPAELSAWIKIPVRTIYDWRTRGRGPRGYRVGKHVIYRRADVEEWILNPRPTRSEIREIPRQRAPRRRPTAK